MVTRSSMPTLEEYVDEIRSIWDTHWLTNMGEKHNRLEAELQKYLKVPNVSLFTNTEKQFYAYSVRGGSMITTPWSKKKSDSYVEITNEAISYFDERKEYKLAQAAMYWQIQFGIEAYERMLMNPKATQDDYNEVMSCVRAGYKRLKLSSLGFGLKKYLKKKLEFFLFTTNPRLLCKLKKKELR